jgi:hypothetical protein
MDVTHLLEKGQDIIANFGMKVAVATVILILGRWIAK